MTSPQDGSGSPKPPSAASSPPGVGSAGALTQRLLRPSSVIIVTSVMFSFISYWRTAAVVLCDLASTAYYIGGIVEQSIGPAAPWFILAVMIFSYAVRSVYIESCSMFIRGGVYRVVREALGKFMAKLAVSALMFDYVLTGPISGVTAGQYIIGLGLESVSWAFEVEIAEAVRATWKSWGSVGIAIAVTLYFFRQNLIGIHESSEKAMRIMIVTTIMAVILLSWCGVTLAVQGPVNPVPIKPQFQSLPDDTLEDPLGFIRNTSLGASLRALSGQDWFSLLGFIGIFIAFGHSILAMSGEETLAQVYREVESPKLKNFRKAAFVVFVYSIILTAGVSFLAVMLIPTALRTDQYKENLLGGLAMNTIGPIWARLLLNAIVVVVGSLILAGAVNTAIIGSNGVLNRVAEDGVIPDSFLKPHPRYGTTYRVLYLIVGLQLFTIVVTRGNVILLGEAYAFGVVWSFVFQALAMVVLRFKDPRPREAKVPLNIRVGRYEVPIGLLLILFILLLSAFFNLLTKAYATIGGLAFTVLFFMIFYFSERVYELRRKGEEHEHLEQFNRQTSPDVTAEALGVSNRPYRKLVAIRSVQNLLMLERALAETDPETTSVVVMTAKTLPTDSKHADNPDLDAYDQQLMTAVVNMAERIGKEVKPLIVPTNNPLHAVLSTARDLQAHELVLGASNKYTADEQLEQVAFYWISLHGGSTLPLTVRILTRDRELFLDLGGGNRIPKISERHARSVAELRAAGVGVDRVLLLHDGTTMNSDLFSAVVTMLDNQVRLALVSVLPPGQDARNGHSVLKQDQQRAEQLDRQLEVLPLDNPDGPTLVERARAEQVDLIIIPLPPEANSNVPERMDRRTQYVLAHAHCRVMLAATPLIPQEVVDIRPAEE